MVAGRNPTSRSQCVGSTGNSLAADCRIKVAIVNLRIALRAVVALGNVRRKRDKPRGNRLAVERNGPRNVILLAFADAARGSGNASHG